MNKAKLQNYGDTNVKNDGLFSCVTVLFMSKGSNSERIFPLATSGMGFISLKVIFLT